MLWSLQQLRTQVTSSWIMRCKLVLQQVGLDCDSNKLEVSLGFSLGMRIGSLCLDDTICAKVAFKMERQFAEAFASVSPMQFVAFMLGNH